MPLYAIQNTQTSKGPPGKVYPSSRCLLGQDNQWTVVKKPRTFKTRDAAQRYLGKHTLAEGTTESPSTADGVVVVNHIEIVEIAQ